MSAKSIFIIIITVLLTIILMNNNEEMSFWLFGDAKVSKLAILGGMFFLGWLIGFLMGKPKAKIDQEGNFEEEENPTDGLSDEDRDYIR